MSEGRDAGGPGGLKPPGKISRFWKHTHRTLVLLGLLGGALAGLLAVSGGLKWGLQQVERLGRVELAGSYPGETWRLAKPAQYAWLQDTWCYPTLKDFHTQFRLEGGVLERRNRSETPVHVDTGWVKTKIYVSNRDMLRIAYEDSDLPASFVTFAPAKPAEWFENERRLRDDGSVVSGRKYLVLSCGRCRVSADGMTYSCG